MDLLNRGLQDDDLPALFTAADTASMHGQREYVHGVRLRLLLAVVAAGLALVTWKTAAVAVAVVFAAMLLIDLRLRARRPEEVWYDGRAVAESAKSLAWRYSVAGLPFAIGDEAEVERRFVGESERLLEDVQTREVVGAARPEVTEAMRGLRGSDLEVRRAAYLAGRVGAQQEWYASRAALNEARARWWRAALVGVEVVGVLVALGRVAGIFDIDFAGLLATMVAAGAAWSGMRQHSTLARAYTFAAAELVIARGRLAAVSDEESWAREVNDAEEAVSREHTMWRASRSGTW
jgi:hypothetical protein